VLQKMSACMTIPPPKAITGVLVSKPTNATLGLAAIESAAPRDGGLISGTG
jgi:hypothetical protein